MASDPQTRARMMAWDVDPTMRPNATGLTIAALIKQWNRPSTAKHNAEEELSALMTALAAHKE